MRTSSMLGFPDEYLKEFGSIQDMDNLAWSDDAEACVGNSGVQSFSSPSTAGFGSSEGPLDSPPFQSSMPYTVETDAPGLKLEGEDFNDRLRELESAMFGPDLRTLDLSEFGFYGGPEQSLMQREKFRIVMQMVTNGDLRGVLIACAKAVSENDFKMAEWLMSHLNHMVSVSGEPIQRLGAYILEGLIARLSSSGSSIYKSLGCKEAIAGSELLSYMHLMYELCPYIKFGYMSANGAIADAMRDENRIHIIDFQISQGTQWFPIIQALSAQPSGPPQIRITGIDDPVSSYARGGGLSIVANRLSQFAESCKVPFEFCGVNLPGADIDYQSLGIRKGEAIAVNFAFTLHHMPDESVNGTQNHRDRLLRLVKSLSPKVVTLIEQESNTNTSPFYPRFIETLDYYTAIFESIDETLPRNHQNRINVEQHCLARDIVNILACEGAERVERHELLGKWNSRFTMAGFSPYPLSSVVNETIRSLLRNYSEKYRLEERDGALYLGWRNRALVASSAWR